MEAARAELIARGADVSDVFHADPATGRAAGPDPQGLSYRSFATFTDPDGNGWLLQEVKTRLPGRGFSSLDVATLTALLRETEQHHGEYVRTAPKHHWSDCYAGYSVARQRGKTAEEAANAGAINTERLL